MNQGCNGVNWTFRNKIQWNVINRNPNIFIQENAFECVVCEMAVILSRPNIHLFEWYFVLHSLACFIWLCMSHLVCIALICQCEILYDPIQIISVYETAYVAVSLIRPWLLWWPPAEPHYNINDHSAVGYVSHVHCIVLLYFVGNKITTTNTTTTTTTTTTIFLVPAWLNFYMFTHWKIILNVWTLRIFNIFLIMIHHFI